MPFKPGNSGNPKGRPRSTSAELARRMAGPSGRDLLRQLYAIFRDERAPYEARIEAARIIRDTGFGKPVKELPRTNVRREAELLFGDKLERVVSGVSKLMQDQYAVSEGVALPMAKAMLGMIRDVLKDEITGD